MATITLARLSRPEALRAAFDSLAWIEDAGRARIAVTGPDAVSFVQGMVTNDVTKVAPGTAVSAAILTSKGAMVTEALIAADGANLVLDVPAVRLEAALEHLSRHLISEDAELAPSDAYRRLTLWGPAAPGWAAEATPLGALAMGARTVTMLVSASCATAIREKLAKHFELDAESAEALRIFAGTPRWGAELVETTIPLEAGLESSINFHKGCYVGQEIIARVTYRGQLRNKLRGLVAEGAPAQLDDALTLDGQAIGRITSAALMPTGKALCALGYLQRTAWPAGTTVQLADGTAARVVDAPFEVG